MREFCKYTRFGTLLRSALLLGLSLAVVSGLTLHARAAVTLSKFEASAGTNGSILVVWETATELNTIAFKLYRSESATGPWTQAVNQQSARGDGATGETYQYKDTDVTPNVRYYYYLEELTQGGVGDSFGPINFGINLATEPTVTATATKTATATTEVASTATRTPTPTRTVAPTYTKTPSEPPTATRQFTNTPRPASTPEGTPAAASTPASSGQATATPLRTVVVATATRRGSASPAVPVTPTLAVVPQPVVSTAEPLPTSQVMTMSTVTDTVQLTPQATQTPQIFESVATTAPLLAGTPGQSTVRPGAASTSGTTGRTGLMLLLGGGAIGLAAVLGVAALLIWRARSR